MEISKADWKLFQDRLRLWQENYMQRLIEGYIEMLQGPGNASSKFWQLERKLKSDRLNPGVSLVLDKQEVINDLVNMIKIGLITLDDLEGFSEGLIHEVKRLTTSEV